MEATTQIDLVRQAAIERYGLDIDGIHGLAHWNRVLENGLLVAEQATADVLIVELFAYLHDCCRESDGHDPDHGPRAAGFAESLRGTLIHLPDARFTLLHEACEGHTCGWTEHDSPTVMACWDADRLDLGRVGIYPNPDCLCTEFAQRAKTIEAAYARSTAR